jgi:hypothetical protein
MPISWKRFLELVNEDTPEMEQKIAEIEPNIAKEIVELFFPDGSDCVDSSSPFARELVELFSSDRVSVSRNDVLLGFRAIATANIRKSESKQSLGNLRFREFLRSVFGMTSFLSARDSSLDEKLRSDQAPDVCGSPLATSAEPLSILCSSTTNLQAVSDFRHQHVLKWDKETRELVQGFFWNLFDFVGVDDGASLSLDGLAAIANDETNKQSSQAKTLVATYTEFLQAPPFRGNRCSREVVERVLHEVSNKVCLSDTDFRTAFNAHSMRKIERAKKVIESLHLRQVEAVKSVVNSDPVVALSPIVNEVPALVSVGADEAYARDSVSVLRAIAADLPRFQLQQSKHQPHPKNVTTQTISICNHKHEIHRTFEFDRIDYGTTFDTFCTPQILPSLSANDHSALMGTAAILEPFRCFFLHLAVELGVHPFALQVIVYLFNDAPCQLCPHTMCFSSISVQHVCRERCAFLSQIIAQRQAAEVASDLQLFSEAIASVLKRCNR